MTHYFLKNKIRLLCSIGLLSSGLAATPQEIYDEAIAVWHMNGLESAKGSHALKATGQVTVGERLTGDELAASQKRGGDGAIATFSGGSLATETTAPLLEGEAFSILIRLRSTDPEWPNGLIFAKHGGHANTTFNLHVNRGQLGFEFGLENRQKLGGRTTTRLTEVTDGQWHDILAIYDGSEVSLYLDGAQIGVVPASGSVRTNVEPVVIGPSVRGAVDHAAIWPRALNPAEIATVSGAEDVAFSPAPSAPTGLRTDRVLADFEGNDFGDWMVEGEAFGRSPVRGGAKGSPAKINGKGCASSDASDAPARGRLLSTPFTIDRNHLNFLVGGDRGGGAVNLLIDGQVVASAQGLSRGTMYPWSFDLASYQGRKAQVEIKDTSGDPKKNQVIHADHFVLSDDSVLETVHARALLDGRFLRLPTSREGRPGRLTITVDGQPVRRGDYLPPRGDPNDYWLWVDVSELKGRKAELLIEGAHKGHPGLKLLSELSSNDAPPGAETIYAERLRPQFHFSPRTGWLNDPNGMLFVDGEWHLFYQFNALGLSIDNQSWGHAVSRDLVHWEELPPAMQPYVFSKGKSYSGSAVVDRTNSSGLRTGKNPLIAVFYTDTGYEPRAECLAYSNDLGRTFIYDKSNPVVKHAENGRDPKVFWYPPTDTAQTAGHWVMVVYSVRDKKDGLAILTSKNLRDWTETDWVPGFYECPEMFQLPVKDASGKPTGESLWVLQGGNSKYALGDFDGRKFAEKTTERLQAIRLPAYAGQCFNDAPGGRVIQMSWIRRHADWAEMPFSQMMSVPLELTLRATPQGVRLFAEPVRELETLRTKSFTRENTILDPNNPLVAPLQGQLYDLELTFARTPDAAITIKLGADEIICGGDGTIDGLPSESKEETVTMRVLVDRPLIEIIGQHGAFYLPKARKGAGEDFTITLTATGNPVPIKTLRVSELKSIWKK